MLPILIVDNNRQIRLLVNRLLSQHGFLVIEAHDGLSALAALRQAGGAVGALLTDIEMDGMNGIELAKTVVAEFPSIPILVMTASEISEDVLRSEVPTCALFVRKPFNTHYFVRSFKGLMVDS
uniref:Response regulator receiver protein n=1 Tax=Solibacter usitatus (strain Ellin6076) TaxID=234267 RepID=Q01TN7_SOLUE